MNTAFKAVQYAPAAARAYNTFVGAPLVPAAVIPPTVTGTVPVMRPTQKRTTSLARLRRQVPRRQRSGERFVPLLPTERPSILSSYAPASAFSSATPVPYVGAAAVPAGPMAPRKRQMTSVGRMYYERGEYDIYLTVLKTDTPALRKARRQLGLPVGWDVDESEGHTPEERAKIQQFHDALHVAAEEERRTRAAQLRRNVAKAKTARKSSWSLGKMGWPSAPIAPLAPVTLRQLMD